MTSGQPLMPRRMLSAFGEEAAREALEALESHAAAFDPAMATGPQRALIRSESETVLRRLAAVEAEALREREETAALAGQRDSYRRAADALSEQGAAAADDLRRLEQAVAAAGERLDSERISDLKTAAWLGGVRAAVEALSEAADGDGDAAGTGGTPPVLRSLSRIGAMLGTMLREAEAQRRRGGEA